MPATVIQAAETAIDSGPFPAPLLPTPLIPSNLSLTNQIYLQLLMLMKYNYPHTKV